MVEHVSILLTLVQIAVTSPAVPVAGSCAVAAAGLAAGGADQPAVGVTSALAGLQILRLAHHLVVTRGEAGVERVDLHVDMTLGLAGHR